MRVVEFVRNGGLGLGRHELKFANESCAPCGIDARAKVLFHPRYLCLPCGGIGGKLQAATRAAKRASMRGDLRADDRGPSALDPRKSSVRAIDAANYVAEKISGAVHGQRILAQGRSMRTQGSAYH